jgi:glycosyltransferase involved in cell wall biosynthesis
MERISVIIPTYNHEDYIGEAIESVLNQTRQSDEIIVVDDGSTDQTFNIISKYLNDIIYVYKSNGGTSTALNTGIRRATGDWICWLSSDDLFMPKKLEKQLEYVNKYPNVGLIYTDFYVIDKDPNKIISRERPPQYPDRKSWTESLLETGCLFNGSTTMIRMSLFYQAGLFVPELLHSQDYNMWIRLSRICDFGYISEPLVKYRWHQGNASHRADPNRYRDLARKKAY